MSDRLIPALSISCGTLTVLYMTLMVATIFFASWETESVSAVRSIQGQIGNLEANYYTALNSASTLNPETLGFVTPSQVKYVSAVQDESAGLSFAGN